MTKKFFIKTITVAVLIGACFIGAAHTHAASFTVDSLLDTSDSNPGDGICDTGSALCTFRAAIQESNATVGVDTITFSASGTVNISTTLPNLADQVTITGPGSSSFIVDGMLVSGGAILNIQSNAAGSIISGIGFTNVNTTAITLQSAANDIQLNNLAITGRGVDVFLGLIEASSATGLQVNNSTITDGAIGIRLVNSDNASIDGVTVSSSQVNGITFYDSDGGSVTDSTLSGNVETDIFVIVGSSNVTIARNTFSSANTSIFMGTGGVVSNILIDSNNMTGPGTSSAVSMDSDVIGVTITGNRIVGYDAGIYADNTPNITIGGNTAAERNIFGNSNAAINLLNISGATIQGNYIGMDTDGQTSLPIGRGIVLNGGIGATVGGTNSGEGNVIGNATSRGIDVFDLTGFVMKGNYVGLAANGSTAATNAIGLYMTNVTNGAVGGTTTNERNIISSSTSDGVVVTGGDTISFVGNYVGLAADGTTVRGNNANGISVSSSTDITIGGTSANQKNVISGNKTYGIKIASTTGVTIKGNYLGLDASGSNMVTAISGASRAGVYIGGSTDVVIGGTTDASRNYMVDTGTGSRGIAIESTLTNAVIIGNYIGLNASGSVTGSLNSGINVSSGVDGTTTTIGGTGTGEGNVISGITFGATAFGIQFQTDTNMKVFGNKIGTTIAGASASGYGNDIGIAIIGGSNGSSNNKIGGLNAGEPNIIAGSSIAGIFVLSFPGAYSTHNAFLGNSIFGGSGVGIDLAHFTGSALSNSGANTNDVGDADTGSNDYLNRPVINSVNTSTGAVTYTLDVPVGTYRIEFFKNPTSGTYGEGETYLGYDTFTSTGTSKSRIKTLSLTSGDFITATATEDLGSGSYGSTSEFSQAYEPEAVVGTPENTPVVTPVVSSGGGSVSTVSGGCPSGWVTTGGVCSPNLPITPAVSVQNVLGSGLCSNDLIITDKMKQGDRDGKYSAYGKQVVKDVAKLQRQINRVLMSRYQQAAGPVDGVFGKLTKQGVERLQMALNEVLKPVPVLKVDGIVGHYTRNALNNSCAK